MRLNFSFSAARVIRPLATNCLYAARVNRNDVKPFSSTPRVLTHLLGCRMQNSILSNKGVLEISKQIPPIQVRTVTKFSLQKGKRKTVKAALRRFMRLHWGGWIRPKVGRHKKLWKKSSAQKRRLRQHVFCNATQSTLLDKMVTKYWKRPRYYVDDPYAPYHTREEFAFTRKKPRV